MIEKIIETIGPSITALPWVDRYGGLTRNAIQVKVDEETGFSEELVFPVSSTTTGNCFETGKYKELIPNDAYKSVSFWALNGPIQVTPDKVGHADTIRYQGFADFKAWINLKKLGLAQEYNPLIPVTLMNAVNPESINIDGIVMLRIKPAQLNVRNENVFAGYSFNERITHVLYPYDYFSITFEFYMQVQADCVANLTIGEGIAC